MIVTAGMRKAERLYERQERAARTRAWELWREIKKLPLEEASYPKVAALFKSGDYDAFRMLDEKPGRFPDYIGGHWFPLLRRTRNNLTHGKQMFKNMEESK